MNSSNLARLLVEDRLEFVMDGFKPETETRIEAVRYGLSVMLHELRTRSGKIQENQRVKDLSTALLKAGDTIKEVHGAYAILYLDNEESVVVGCIVEHIDSGIAYLRCVIFESTNHHNCYVVEIDPEPVFEW